jgi:hypothetical protein
MVCLSYYAYGFSSTKSDIRTDHFLPGKDGWVEDRMQGGEMTLIIYVHVNKWIKKVEDLTYEA